MALKLLNPAAIFPMWAPPLVTPLVCTNIWNWYYFQINNNLDYFKKLLDGWLYSSLFYFSPYLKYFLCLLPLAHILTFIRGDFTNKQISISCKLLHVVARGWQGGFTKSVLINVFKVLLMSRDFIKTLFIHTHIY